LKPFLKSLTSNSHLEVVSDFFNDLARCVTVMLIGLTWGYWSVARSVAVRAGRAALIHQVGTSSALQAGRPKAPVTAAFQAVNFITVLPLKNTLAAAASARAALGAAGAEAPTRSGQGRVRAAIQPRAGQGRARAAPPFRAGQGRTRAWRQEKEIKRTGFMARVHVDKSRLSLLTASNFRGFTTSAATLPLKIFRFTSLQVCADASPLLFVLGGGGD
jgi:hypothetical protein